MRLHIAHSMICRYDPPVSGAFQLLRLTPRNHNGQYVVRWRIEVTPDVRLAAREDAFGNITHLFTADGLLDELRVDVDGEVDTQNTEGVVRGAVERFPPSLFLRDTGLTQADSALCQFADVIRGTSDSEVLNILHALLRRIHGDWDHNPDPAPLPPKAAEAFVRRKGTAADLTHIFIGAARQLGIPARFVAGYCRHDESAELAGHAWAEAHVPDLGWVGFDSVNGFCPTDAHMRVAVGLDALGAAPIRGTRYGAGGETPDMAIAVGQ